MTKSFFFYRWRDWGLFAVIALGLAEIGPFDLAAAPLELWHWRNPLPQGNALNNVFYENGNWLAVGELGTVLTSTNGTNWVRQETGVLDDLRDCAYGDGTYVVVGDFGTVLTSTDGVEWTQQFAGTFYALNGITFANGQFIAVGEQTTIVTSPDGVDWTQRSSGNWELFDVIQAEGEYVAVGGVQPTVSTVGVGVILTSPDARNWNLRLLVSDYPFNNIAYGQGQFAATAGGPYATGYIWTSDDAVTWGAINGPGFYGSSKLFYDQGRWLLADGNSYSSYGGVGTLFNSTNLSDWVVVMTNTVPVTGIASAAGGRIVASHMDGTFSTSTDALDWADTPPGELPDDLRDLEYVNGSFCALGNNQIAYSIDGAIWTNLVNLTNTGNLTSITYGNGRYVAGGEYRTVWTSTNGLDWTNPAPDLSIEPYLSDVAVAYGNGVFVGAAGFDGDVLTSSDGLNWMVQQLETNANNYLYFADVKFGNGRFVAVGNGSIATSIDGTNWNLTSPGQYLSGVACGNGTFVAVGDNTILTSKDGTNWTAQISGQFQSLSSVAFGAGFFVVTQSGPYFGNPYNPVENLIWISTDGVHWASRHSNTMRSLAKSAFGNGTFVLAGVAGAVLQSDPLVELSLTMQPAPALVLSGPVNRSYHIEYVTGLSDAIQWNDLTTLAATNMPTTFVDLSWTNDATRFYRATLLP